MVSMVPTATTATRAMTGTMGIGRAAIVPRVVTPEMAETAAGAGSAAAASMATGAAAVRAGPAPRRSAERL